MPLFSATFKRIVFHVLLATFVANAANRFFIPDLQFEEEHQFYEAIFNFEGQAPDQYRILPLLMIKTVRGALRLGRPSTPFNHGVLVFNFICGFLIFELLFGLLHYKDEARRIGFNILLAVGYIYTQYTGWRPDTLGLLFLCLLYVFWIDRKKETVYLHLFFLLLLAFSRADIALIYGVFMGMTRVKNWAIRGLFVAIPIAVQMALQFYFFKEATYYTKPMMFWDNLVGYYLAYNPATWLILALVVWYFKEIKKYIAITYQKVPTFYWLLGGYLLLILVVGRLNEYRLYLPFIPLLILTDKACQYQQKDQSL